MHSQPCFRPDHSPTLQTTQHFSHRPESQGAVIKIENQATFGICGFATELHQLFTNLIVNAVEAGAGNIRIRILDSRDWKKLARRGLRIVIADNGAGFTPAVAAKAFEPFFTTKEERGTALVSGSARASCKSTKTPSPCEVAISKTVEELSSRFSCRPVIERRSVGPMIY